MEMTLKEFQEICEKYHKEFNWFEDGDFYYVGFRFEDKVREIGEICENSKHNQDREDEREFPEFGTPEYDEMEELGGTSSWHIDGIRRGNYGGEHCYVVVGHKNFTHDDIVLDDDEICIVNAKVVAQIF
jgi:hypothetical protein